MVQTDIEKMKAELKELRRHMSDITRNLDESPAIEQEDLNNDKLQRLRERVIALEQKISELEKG